MYACHCFRSLSQGPCWLTSLDCNADAQRDAEMPAATEGTLPQHVTEAGPTSVAGSDDQQSQPSEYGGPVSEAAA